MSSKTDSGDGGKVTLPKKTNSERGYRINIASQEGRTRIW